MVFEFHDTFARKFKACRHSTGKEPVPRRPAALCASALVPVSILKRIGTKTDWCVVGKRRARNLLSAGEPEGGPVDYASETCLTFNHRPSPVGLSFSSASCVWLLHEFAINRDERRPKNTGLFRACRPAVRIEKLLAQYGLPLPLIEASLSFVSRH